MDYGFKSVLHKLHCDVDLIEILLVLHRQDLLQSHYVLVLQEL